MKTKVAAIYGKRDVRLGLNLSCQKLPIMNC